MKDLIWWVSSNFDVIQRPGTIGQSRLPEVEFGSTTVLTGETDTCPYSGRKGLLAGRVFDDRESAIVAAKALRDKAMEDSMRARDQAIKKMEYLEHCEFNSVMYADLVDDGLKRERERLLGNNAGAPE